MFTFEQRRLPGNIITVYKILKRHSDVIKKIIKPRLE